MIEKNSSGTWNVSIAGTGRRSYNSGMTVGSVVQAGGEVTKFSSATNNAMGISGIHDMKYKRVNNLWYAWNTWHNTHVDTSDGYTLVQIGGSYDDFQNYGNNP